MPSCRVPHRWRGAWSNLHLHIGGRTDEDDEGRPGFHKKWPPYLVRPIVNIESERTRMNKIAFILLLAAVPTLVSAQHKTLQERLGYTADTKLLIIHADDIGVSYSENSASKEAFKAGLVNSGSIMVPCPWFPEIANYVKSNPRADLGLHLTLTSEWNLYKWGPVAPKEKVPSLVNDKGCFYASVQEVITNGSP